MTGSKESTRIYPGSLYSCVWKRWGFFTAWKTCWHFYTKRHGIWQLPI